MIQLLSASIFLFIAIRFPPVMLAIFMMIGGLEAFGVGQVVGIPSAYAGYMIPICIARVLWKLWQESQDGHEEHRAFAIGAMTAGFLMWQTLSLYYAGEEIRGIYNTLANNGTCGLLVILAYRRQRWVMGLLVGVVLFHAVLGTLMTFMPSGPWVIFSAAGYLEITADLPDFVGISYKGLNQVSGQFINPIQLAFYGGVATILGGYLFFKQPGLIWKYALGLMLIVMGLWLQFATMTRMIWIALLVIGLFALWQSGKRSPTLLTLITVLFLASVVFFYEISVWFSSMFSEQSRIIVAQRFIAAFNVYDQNERISAFFMGIDFLPKHLLFGAGTIENWFSLTQGHATPHIAPLFYGVMYGLPGFAYIIALLYFSLSGFFIGMRTSYVSGEKSSQSNGMTLSDLLIAEVLCILVLALAVTNNFAGRTLTWVCLGYSCLPWVMFSSLYGVKETPSTSVARSLPIRQMRNLEQKSL